MSLRTVTYNVSFNTADAEAGGKRMSLTLKSMQGDTTKAKQSLEKLVTTIGEKYNVKTKVAVQDTTAFKNEVRDTAREINRSNKVYDQLNREYRQLSQLAGKSADEQQVLNAQFRLGAGATNQQKEAVAKLVREYQQHRNAVVRTQGSMRGLRGQMSNLGFQLQDIAVQAQMGTNAFVILGQQGSQLAAGFGPTGALVGAAIAIGAAFAGVGSSLFNTGKQVDELREKLIDLRKTQLLTIEQAQFLNNAERERIDTANEQKKSLDGVIQGLKNQIELSKNTQKNYDAESKTLENLIKGEDNLRKKLVEKQSLYQDQESIIKDANRQIELNNSAVFEATDVTKSNNEQNEKLVTNYRKLNEELGLTDVQLTELRKKRALEVLTSQNASDEQITLAENYFNSKIAIQNAEAATRDKAQSDAEAAKAANELASAERNRLSVLSRLGGEFNLSALKARYEQERALFANNAEVLAELEKEYNNQRILATGSAWEQYAAQAREALQNTDQIMINSLDRFTAGFGNFVQTAIFDTQNIGDAFKSMFTGAIGAMVSFYAEWAAQQLLLLLLDRGNKKAAGAADATAAGTNASADVTRAGLATFASISAIPIVGPALAPAAAQAAIAATTPLAATIASLKTASVAAYDAGGVIMPGAAGIVAEYGDEFAGGTMIYNGSQRSLRVTGRAETARQVGRGSSGPMYINITSEGNATADEIANSLVRALKRKGKTLDTALYDATQRGSRNRGKRFNA